jgi:hypothetical protein
MEMTDKNTIILSNRSGKDRRIKSGFNIRSLLSGGKREKIRRKEDSLLTFDFLAGCLVFVPWTRIKKITAMNTRNLFHRHFLPLKKMAINQNNYTNGMDEFEKTVIRV